MATLQQLETALINADKAGDMAAARQIAAVLKRNREDPMNQVPGTEIPETMQRQEEPSLGQNIVGAGETALALGSGATGGALGMIGGTLKGLAEQLLSGQFGTQQAADAVEQAAMGGAEALTYAPRTQAGQEQTAAVGEALAPLAALAPMTAELGVIGQGARALPGAARAAAPAVQEAAGKIIAPIKGAAEKIKAAVRPASADEQAGAGGARSGGAAAVEAGRLRQAKANELPVPIKLTEGQRSRELGQQRFERETAKDPEMGGPIRERFEDQNMKLQQNLDDFIDRTGAEAGDLRSAGEMVDKALRGRAAKDKVKIRAQYKAAREAGDMADPVNLEGVLKHLNESAGEVSTAPLLKTVRDLAVKMKIARDEGGVLVPIREKPRPSYTGAKPEPGRVKEVDLNTAETFRQAINRNTNQEGPNIRQATIIKGIIDSATEGKGGPLYRRARSTYGKFKKDYENIGLVKNLIGQKKGSTDRAIALEDVVRRSVIDPATSLDDVRHIRRLLQTEGDKGKQAWKELQGATLNHIKDEATKNVARDQQGNAIVSPAQLDRALQKLDKNGKLDFVFGKKGAEMLRTINDVAKDVLVATPGAVNTSNTASVLAGLMDVAISGTSGVPAPLMTSLRLMTKSIKDRKTRARVQRALGVHRTEEQ